MEEGVISMLYESGMPTAFWGKALAAFIHTRNRSSTSALPDQTPFEAFYGAKPDLSMLRVWGCTAYVLIQRDKRPLGSLGSHTEKCVFIGYPQGYKGWKFYNPVTKKVIISERADFDERFLMLQKHSVPQFPPPHPESLIDPPPAISLLPELLEDALDPPEVPQKSNHGGDGSTSSDQPSVPFISPHSPSTPSQSTASTYISFPPHTPSPAPPPARSIAPPHAQIDPPSSTRPQCIRRPRDEWLRDQYVVPECYRQPREPTPVIPSSDEEEDDSDDPLDNLKAHAASTAEPTTYRQSQHCSDADLWHTACQEEMEAHSVNGTWEIVKLPPGKHAIGSRWFLMVKHNADGFFDSYK